MEGTSGARSFRGAAGQAAETLHGAIAIAPLDNDLRAGTEIAGYRLDELVGRGGMGVVYRAQHVHLGRAVALKLLTPQLSVQPDFRERFVREARVAASIQHPNVVTIYDSGEADGMLYLAMQYVDGPDLGVLLARGPLDAAQTLAILEQVAAGLDAAHAAGVVHRDVKPGNVLVDRHHCYLTDFGLTRHVSSTSALTHHGAFVGTLDYVAPEQIAGGPVDARADVYSLGCLLFEMLAGEVPFPHTSQVAAIYAHLEQPPRPLASLRPELPAALDAVVARALAKRAEERYESCSELVAAAREAHDGAGVTPASAPLERRVRPARVLVASSQLAIGAAVRGMLGAERFSYETAENGRDVLEFARNRTPEVVVLDWSLPGLTAAQVIRTLRAHPRTSGVGILVVASRAAAPDDAALEAAGADGLLIHPFSSVQLQLRVGELLRRGTPSSG